MRRPTGCTPQPTFEACGAFVGFPRCSCQRNGVVGEGKVGDSSCLARPFCSAAGCGAQGPPPATAVESARRLRQTRCSTWRLQFFPNWHLLPGHPIPAGCQVVAHDELHPSPCRRCAQSSVQDSPNVGVAAGPKGVREIVTPIRRSSRRATVLSRYQDVCVPPTRGHVCRVGACMPSRACRGAPGCSVWRFGPRRPNRRATALWGGSLWGGGGG